MEQKNRKTYIYHNPTTGLIEHICEETGRVILFQKSLEDNLLNDYSKTIPYTTTDGVETRVEKGLENMGLVYTKRWIYSETLANIICQKITEGKSLFEICQPKEFKPGDKKMPPYFIIQMWRRERPEFDELVRRAFKDRGEMLAGRALSEAENADEDNATAQKLVVDTLKWGASVDDPDKFGNKTKISGDTEAPLVFIINTGIRRPGDPGYIEPKEVGPTKEIEHGSEIGDGSLLQIP